MILIYSMKKETLNDIIERIASAHLGVGNLLVADVRNLSTFSLRSALIEAVKAGEKVGYDEGYTNAKQGCDKKLCDCEDTLYTT